MPSPTATAWSSSRTPATASGHPARHPDGHPDRHLASPASPCRTSSPPPAPAAWSARRRRAGRPALLLRRWGRRSRAEAVRVEEGQGAASSAPSTGLEYDNLFIFDEVGWNFEPSELSAAFGLVQMGKLRRQPGPPAAQLRAHRVPLRPWPDAFRPAAADRRGRDRLAHVPDPHQPGLRVSAGPTSSSGWSRTASTPAWSGRATSPASPRGPTAGSPRRAAQRRPGDGERVSSCPTTTPSTMTDCAYIGESCRRLPGGRGLPDVPDASRGGGRSSPAPAGASARPSPSGSRPRAPMSSSPRRTLDKHERLAGSLRATRSASQHGGRVGIVVADLTDEQDRRRSSRRPRASSADRSTSWSTTRRRDLRPVVDFPLKRRRLIFEANVHAPLDLASQRSPRCGRRARAGSSTSERHVPGPGSARPSASAPPAPRSRCTGRRRLRSTG